MPSFKRVQDGFERRIIMNSIYIKQMINFFKQSDLPDRFIDIYPVTKKDGQKTVYQMMESTFFPLPLRKNLVLSLSILFSLVDAYVDLKHPDLVNYCFKDKAKRLPNTEKTEACFKECYSVLRVLRNACIHSKDDLVYHNEVLSYEETTKKENDRIVIREEGIDYLTTFFRRVIGNDFGNNFTSTHKKIFTVALYNKIKESIKDFTRPLQNIKNPEPFGSMEWSVRYYFKNPDFEKKSDDSFEITEKPIQHYPTDYLINFQNNQYLIPSEILSDSPIITLEEAKEWKLEETRMD